MIPGFGIKNLVFIIMIILKRHGSKQKTNYEPEYIHVSEDELEARVSKFF